MHLHSEAIKFTAPKESSPHLLPFQDFMIHYTFMEF